MRHNSFWLFSTKTLLLFCLYVFVGLFPQDVVCATIQTKLSHDQDIALFMIDDVALKEIIITIYSQAEHHKITAHLPPQLLLCYALLQDNKRVTKEDLVVAVKSVLDWSKEQLRRSRTKADEERAPRPDGMQPVPPNDCCNIDEVLALLGIINAKLNTLTPTAFVDLSPVFTTLTVIENCCSNLTATVINDFNATWTILAALTTPTVVVSVDLSPVFTTLTVIENCCSNLTTTVINDFNATWTILAALTTPTVIVTIDLSPVFTVLKTIQDADNVEIHCPTILAPSDILPNGYTITNPGYYTLCGSVGFSGTSTCVISIKSNNVTLDLNQHTLYQTNFGLNVTGICVSAALSNIVIKSGKISGMTGSGITVANGTEDFVVSDMTVRGCGGAGIAYSGTTGSKNLDITIDNSRFTNNGGNGGIFTFTEKVKITNSKFNDNFLVGASFTSSNGNEISNSTFNKNGGAGIAAGLSLNATGSTLVRNCIMSGNFSTTGTATGLLLTSTGNVVDSCFADGNSSSVAAGFAIGFDLSGAAHIVNNCSAVGNSATAGAGSIGVGFRAGSNAFGCLIKNSSSLTNSARGFEHDAPSGYNFFLGNLSGGHGSDAANYFGAGLGWLSVSGGMQITTFNENQRINNVSLT
jgi:hypothetical protein